MGPHPEERACCGGSTKWNARVRRTRSAPSPPNPGLPGFGTSDRAKSGKPDFGWGGVGGGGRPVRQRRCVTAQHRLPSAPPQGGREHTEYAAQVTPYARCRYLCAFSRMMVIRRSVTGWRLAAASSVAALRLAAESSVSSPTHSPSDWPFASAFPSNGCSRKDEDRSGVRLAGCCLRKTRKTLILSPSPTKSMSPCSLSRSFKASLTEFLAFCASVRRTESFEDLSRYSSQPFSV